MSCRPVTPPRSQREISMRDATFSMQAGIQFDTPFVPIPPFPCYEPVVCAQGELGQRIFPAFLVTDTGDSLVSDTPDFIVAGAEE